MNKLFKLLNIRHQIILIMMNLVYEYDPAVHNLDAYSMSDKVYENSYNVKHIRKLKKIICLFGLVCMLLGIIIGTYFGILL